MTPHRDKRRTDGGGAVVSGSYIIDRRLRHVGRIKRSSGTNHLPTFRRVDEMLTTLHSMGRLDLLRAVRDGHLSPLQVYEAYRIGELERLPTVETMGPLGPALEAFCQNVTAGDRHRSSLRTSAKHLTEAGGPAAIIADLPEALRSLRVRLGSHARSFNLARAAAQAFARERYGRRSKLWLDVSNVAPLEERKTRKGHPVMPRELAAICDRLPSGVSAMAWTLAVTGMGPREYWEREGSWWKDEGAHVHIRGTKRAGRDRNIPRVRDLAPPCCGEVKFRKLLADASEGALQPYDLRRTFAHWMELARVPRTRRRLYMGHGRRDVTDLYEFHEVTEFLSGDANALRQWIGEQLAGRDAKIIPIGRAAGDS